MLRSGECVPKNQYSLFLQDVAKLLEAAGDIPRAAIPLKLIMKDNPTEWKLVLDLILQEVHVKMY